MRCYETVFQYKNQFERVSSGLHDVTLTSAYHAMHWKTLHFILFFHYNQNCCFSHDRFSHDQPVSDAYLPLATVGSFPDQRIQPSSLYYKLPGLFIAAFTIKSNKTEASSDSIWPVWLLCGKHRIASDRHSTLDGDIEWVHFCHTLFISLSPHRMATISAPKAIYETW